MRSTHPLTRHTNRYKDASPEETKQRIVKAAKLPGGYSWPEFRIGRAFDLNNSQEWDTFQNDFGRLNKRKGNAYVAGQIAVHYVLDAEMRSMIMKKYDPSYRDAGKVYQTISRRVTAFIRSEQRHWSPRFNGSLNPSDFAFDDNLPQHFYDAPHFGKAVLQVEDLHKGTFHGFDNHKFGLDLHNNGFLFDERNVVINILKQEEKLDTSLIRKDWEPHATTMEVHPHLRVDDLVFDFPASIPTILPCEAVASI